MNGIDQRGHRIIQRPRIFHGLTGCQPDPLVGASQCLCQILHYIVLLLGAYYILLLLILILLMLFMLLVSVLLHPLQFIGQLFFVFCGIFKVQSFIVFYFHPPLLWSYVQTLMLIMAVTPLIANLLLVSVSF